MEVKGEGGRQRMCETGGTKAPGGGELVGDTVSVFTGTSNLGASGASRRGVQGKARETCVGGIRWGKASSLETGEGTC